MNSVCIKDGVFSFFKFTDLIESYKILAFDEKWVRGYCPSCYVHKNVKSPWCFLRSKGNILYLDFPSSLGRYKDGAWSGVCSPQYHLRWFFVFDSEPCIEQNMFVRLYLDSSFKDGGGCRIAG